MKERATFLLKKFQRVILLLFFTETIFQPPSFTCSRNSKLIGRAGKRIPSAEQLCSSIQISSIQHRYLDCSLILSMMLSL